MIMRNSFKCLAVTTLFLLAVSCTSIDSDAKKAAKLINKSIEQTHAMKLEDAEKSFLKAQEIINGYNEKGKTEEFFQLFVTYRDKEKKQIAK